MKNNRTKRKYSHITNRIFARYIISLLLLCLSLISAFFLAFFICTRFVWFKDQWLYRFLKVLEALSPIIIVVGIMAGFMIITYLTIKKPFNYLDETICAVKSLSTPSQEPIEMADEMLDVQNELNLVREQALKHIMLVKEAEQRKNELIMYLAHDLKTPLASVMGYLNLLHDEKEISEELREKYLKISIEKAQRLEDLINEFFEIARFHISDVTLHYTTINLTRMMEQLIYEFKPMLKEKNLNCNLNIAEDVLLNCDADQLSRAFDNLLRNAVIYSYPQTDIDITVVGQENQLSIVFLNYGETISQEKLQRIFEQFYRLDASRNTRGGTGLGLAIAKQIVELHNGTITARSENGQIEFTITLPVL